MLRFGRIFLSYTPLWAHIHTLSVSYRVHTEKCLYKTLHSPLISAGCHPVLPCIASPTYIPFRALPLSYRIHTGGKNTLRIPLGGDPSDVCAAVVRYYAYCDGGQLPCIHRQFCRLARHHCVCALAHFLCEWRERPLGSFPLPFLAPPPPTFPPAR